MIKYSIKRFINISSNKNRILSLLKSTKRPGIISVIDWILDSDYFEAPASMKHGNFPGGLAEHSLNVYNIAHDVSKIPSLKSYLDFKEDSIIISSLLHDICKVNLEPGETTGPYHGQKSLDILDDLGLDLKECERAAIRYHMGPAFEFQGGKQEVLQALKASKISPLVGIIHYADSTATITLEKGK